MRIFHLSNYYHGIFLICVISSLVNETVITEWVYSIITLQMTIISYTLYILNVAQILKSLC